MCTYDGKDAKIYIDGEVINEAPHGLELVAGEQDLRFGHRGGSRYWYNGLLDDVAVFSVVLDEDQVKEASGNIDEALDVEARGN